MQYHYRLSLNRLQYVCIKQNHSSRLPLKYEVPPGSVLGPILPLLYINDLAYIKDTTITVLFADDTYYQSYHPSEMHGLGLEDNEGKLFEWFLSNMLSLND